MAKDTAREGSQGMVYTMVPEGEAYEQTDEEKAFQDFRASFQADQMGVIRVGRLTNSKLTGAPTSTKSVHCFSCPIDRYDFDELLEFIRENYGGGLYRILGFQKGEKGIRFNRLAEIADNLKPKAPDQATPQSPSALMDSISNLIISSQERTEAMLARFSGAARPAVPGSDPSDMIMKTMSMFTSMLTAMAPIFGAQKQGGDILGEIEKLTKLKDLVSSFASDGNGDGGEGNFYSMAGKVVENFAPLINTAIQNAALNPKALAAPESPEATVIPATPGTPPMPRPKTDPLKGQVDILLMNAKIGTLPEAMAETVIDATPDEKLVDLEKFVKDQHVIERMAQANPEVRAYLPFFQALRENLLRLLKEIESDNLPDSSATGAAVPSGTAVPNDGGET
jgi:hypothetical protein